MEDDLTVHASVNINATDDQVWEALVNPRFIKQYLFDTHVTSDWKEGSSITWEGIHEGKTYKEKGIIKKIEPYKILQHTFLSSMSGKEDKPENYATVTYTLFTKDSTTELSLTQDHNDTVQVKEHSQKNWQMVLEKLKEVVENEYKILEL